MSGFKQWVTQLAGENASERGIARRTGINSATFHRKMAEDAFTPDDAVTIARAYHRSPIEALVKLGTITPEEAMKADKGYSLREYSNLELSEELVRRMREDAETAQLLDRPVSDFIPSEENNETQ